MDDHRITPDEYQAKAMEKWRSESSSTIRAIDILRKYAIPIRIIISVALYAFIGFLYKDYRIGQGSKFDDWAPDILVIVLIAGFNILYPKFITHLDKKVGSGEERTKQDIANYRSQYMESEKRAIQKRASEIESLYSAIRELDCYRIDILPFLRILNIYNEELHLTKVIESIDHHRSTIQEKCQQLNRRAQELGLKERVSLDCKDDNVDSIKQETMRLNSQAKDIVSKPPYQSTHILCYDGLYCYQGSYIRFYQDGTVIGVSSTGNASQVARWFGKNMSDVSAGRYLISNSSISFFIESSAGRVEYHGKIVSPTFLILNSHSFINSHQVTNQEYTFTRVRLLLE